MHTCIWDTYVVYIQGIQKNSKHFTCMWGSSDPLKEITKAFKLSIKAYNLWANEYRSIPAYMAST